MTSESKVIRIFFADAHVYLFWAKIQHLNKEAQAFTFVVLTTTQKTKENTILRVYFTRCVVSDAVCVGAALHL